MKLSEVQADTLLDKLSSDDDFRGLFQKDPRAALVAIGHEPAADGKVSQGAWMCMSVRELASKEAIKASRDELRKQLVSAMGGQHPISLEVQRR
jgi:putative modified peptide